jgi:outer membrane lipoprotein LolB
VARATLGLCKKKERPAAGVVAAAVAAAVWMAAPALTAADRPAQGLTAAFELQGQAERGELRLLSPLGSQLASARWAPGQALLETPAGSRAFSSLDELSLQALGEVLPLAALPDWLAGRPWPGAAHRAASTGFEQLGWRVDLARQAEGWVQAQRDTPPAVVLRVRLDGPSA